MLKRALLLLIRIYQKYLKSLFPSSCRYTPSCSEYTKEAIEKYGIIKGGILGTGRIVSCHPFSGKSGHNPLI